MKHLKKALCLVLALALCVGLFSACGGDGGSSSAAPGSSQTESKQDGSSSEAAGDDASEPEGGDTASGDKIDPTACGDMETMKVSVANLSGYSQDGSMMQKHLEEKYNIDIDLIVLPGWTDGPTKLNTLMASDDMPSLIWWGWANDKEYQQWKDAGLLVEVSEYYNKYTNMRDYYNSMNPMTLFYDTEDDGKMYRMPASCAEPACESLYIRQDWLDELKLDEIKTKKFVAVMNNLKVEKGLVVIADNDKNVVMSARNLADIDTALANMINTYDVMKAKTVVLTKDAVAKIEEVFA